MIVRGTNINMIRGDTETIHVNLKNPDGSIRPFNVGDKLYFTVKKAAYQKEKMLQKVITKFETDGTALIELSPTDTNDLEVRTYVYDIQLTERLGIVTTLVPKSDFKISAEVTYE